MLWELETNADLQSTYNMKKKVSFCNFEIVYYYSKPY